MSNPTQDPPPRRLLILDKERGEWLLATVQPTDVIPADLDARRQYTGWGEVARWVRSQMGHPVGLAPVWGLAWTIEDHPATGIHRDHP